VGSYIRGLARISTIVDKNLARQRAFIIPTSLIAAPSVAGQKTLNNFMIKFLCFKCKNNCKHSLKGHILNPDGTCDYFEGVE
jgi:hypothetical protein